MTEEQEDRDAGNRYLIGVDIGGTKIAIVLCLQPPVILERVVFATLPEQGAERALRLIQENIHQLIEKYGIGPGKLAAIGISCGNPMDRVAGVILSPPNLPGWNHVPIVEVLQREFAVPCRLENDANAGAVAEHRFGAGQGTQHMIFLTMGTGLGSGIIADGKLYRGATDTAGEIGHLRLTRSGPIGYNKVGSVEGWASGGGMAQVAVRKVTAAIENGEVTALTTQLSTNRILTAKDVAVAARQGDELAKQIVHSTGTRLGEALAILVDLLNPEVIVIGGLALRFGESILAPARAVVEKEALSVPAKACRIVPAGLGEQIGDLAAICVAMGL